MEITKRVGAELRICPDVAGDKKTKEELDIKPGSMEDIYWRFRIPYDSRDALLKGLRNN